ncbi:MAG: mechanosensitive ion channel, partial [Gammaproteobacteria bacterium]|nr:mechanosensitive ion channel [Gammaproteobacteria bacterium]
MKVIADWIHRALAEPPDWQAKLLLSVAVIAALWVIRLLVMEIICRRSEDVRVRYAWRKISTYVAALFTVLFLGLLWSKTLRNSTFLGLLAAGVAIALKDIVANGAGWIFIVWRRPFSVGDRIQIGENAGDVIDIRLFEFTLLEIGNWVDADQSTGRIVHVP